MSTLYQTKLRSKLRSDDIKCSVCLERVKDPEELPCQHKFCQKCTRQQFERISFLRSSYQPVSIVCPYCRDFFLTGSRGPTFDIRDAAFGHGKGHVPKPRENISRRCQPCQKGGEYCVASLWCHNCSEYLCSVCAKFHKSMKMSEDHRIKPARDGTGFSQATVKSIKRRETKKEDRKWSHGTQKSWCMPCKRNEKEKFAKFWCERCDEKFCDDCTKCHRTMKMSKSHKLIPIYEVLKHGSFGLDLKCQRHYGETLNLYCKRCQKSCCGICAITIHSDCGAAKKIKSTAEQTRDSIDKSLSKSFDMGLSMKETEYESLYDSGKYLSRFSEKPKAIQQSGYGKTSPEMVRKELHVAKVKMDHRKTRINFGSVTDGDWVISMALLTTGDLLIVELYQPDIKLINVRGELLSSCTFYGDPWAVAVYDDTLAVVTFSDRKQIQLVNIDRENLKAGKKMGTRHKSQAVCFAKQYIVTSCWDGCIHVMNIRGDEICHISKDYRGERLFSNPEYIATNPSGSVIYVSDYKRNTVTALKLLPNRFEPNPEFIFSDTELNGPKGVVVDRYGVIYISGMTSRNLFRVSPGGKVVQVFRRREDTEYYEALAITPSGEELLVSAYEDDTIIVFRLKK